MNEAELEHILAEAPVDPQSTKAMRRALYRMGRSRSWVHRYAMSREEAAKLIDSAIAEMEFLKRQEQNSIQCRLEI